MKLPLPNSADAEQPSIDFVVMMIDLSNRERLCTHATQLHNATQFHIAVEQTSSPVRLL